MPGMHLLQTSAWGQLKAQFGWQAEWVPLVGQDEPTLMLFRRLPLGFRFAYVPKGPAINWLDSAAVGAALLQLRAAAQRRQTIFLKIEPDTLDRDLVAEAITSRGFRPGRTIQPPSTILLKIDDEHEDAILKRMKSKTRYNIRLADRKGVQIREGTRADITTFHALSQTTSQRNEFGVHSQAYYEAAFDLFPAENRALLLAEFEGEALAGLMVFAHEGWAYYLYGASSDRHRNLMPTYALQWAAIRWARAQGCHTYDLWGIPDAPPAQLEAEFQERSDGLWGVYRAKRGYGGRIIRSIGAFDYVYQPLPYQLLNLYLRRRDTA